MKTYSAEYDAFVKSQKTELRPEYETKQEFADRQKAEEAATALFGKGKPLTEMDEQTLLELVKEAPYSRCIIEADRNSAAEG